jgi:hypothetical protein
LILLHVTTLDGVAESIERLFQLAVRVSQIARELTRQVAAKAFRYQTASARRRGARTRPPEAPEPL